MTSLQDISFRIKSKARELNFDFVGMSKAQKLDEEERLREWLNKGFQGEMQYMENHFEKRLNPSLLVPGARSVISLMYNYFPSHALLDNSYKIAKYAYGKDYHKVIKKRLKMLTEFLEELFPDCQYRVFVDSAPVMERQWAEKSGLGWIGKNTLLINKKKGSFFFLAEIIIDQELAYDGPIEDHCGTCTRCLDACPTNAFPEPYVLDASKCISYATIELKSEELPSLFENKMEDWVFGCDICQDVCPWNRFSSPHIEDEFLPKKKLLEMKKENWHELTEDEFNQIFESSAVNRSRYSGLKRNISFVRKD